MAKSDDQLWKTRQEMAALLGMSARHFDEAIRPKARDAERGTGKDLRLLAPAVIRAWKDAEVEEAVRKAGGDAMMAGGEGSAALEMFRAENAKIRRLDRLEREGSLIPRDRIRDGFARVASIIRGAGDKLQRDVGEEAYSILVEALDDAQREVNAMFPEETEPSKTSSPAIDSTESEAS